MPEVPVDPAREARHVDRPAHVGVVNIPTAQRGRWYYQDQFSSFVKRRVIRHLESFETHHEFVEFAIEAARIRNMPPPNYQRKTPASEHWSTDRIGRALESLLRGNTLRSKSLHFFNAACDELEGFAWGADAPVVETSDPTSGEVEMVPEHMAGNVVADEEIDDSDLRHRYVTMLIVKAEEHDGIPPDELLDRIERLIF